MNRKLVLLLPLFLMLAGCPQPTEQTARDSIAAAHGWVSNAQATWGASCRADNTQAKCVSTNKLIAAEHIAADALTAYCSGPGSTYPQGGACVPVQGSANALTAAVMNLNAIVNDVKSLLARSK